MRHNIIPQSILWKSVGQHSRRSIIWERKSRHSLLIGEKIHTSSTSSELYITMAMRPFRQTCPAPSLHVVPWGWYDGITVVHRVSFTYRKKCVFWTRRTFSWLLTIAFRSKTTFLTFTGNALKAQSSSNFSVRSKMELYHSETNIRKRFITEKLLIRL